MDLYPGSNDQSQYLDHQELTKHVPYDQAHVPLEGTLQKGRALSTYIKNQVFMSLGYPMSLFSWLTGFSSPDRGTPIKTPESKRFLVISDQPVQMNLKQSTQNSEDWWESCTHLAGDDTTLCYLGTTEDHPLLSMWVTPQSVSTVKALNSNQAIILLPESNILEHLDQQQQNLLRELQHYTEQAQAIKKTLALVSQIIQKFSLKAVDVDELVLNNYDHYMQKEYDVNKEDLEVFNHVINDEGQTSLNAPIEYAADQGLIITDNAEASALLKDKILLLTGGSGGGGASGGTNRGSDSTHDTNSGDNQAHLENIYQQQKELIATLKNMSGLTEKNCSKYKILSKEAFYYTDSKYFCRVMFQKEPHLLNPNGKIVQDKAGLRYNEECLRCSGEATLYQQGEELHYDDFHAIGVEAGRYDQILPRHRESLEKGAKDSLYPDAGTKKDVGKKFTYECVFCAAKIAIDLSKVEKHLNEKCPSIILQCQEKDGEILSCGMFYYRQNKTEHEANECKVLTTKSCPLCLNRVDEKNYEEHYDSHPASERISHTREQEDRIIQLTNDLALTTQQVTALETMVQSHETQIKTLEEENNSTKTSIKGSHRVLTQCSDDCAQQKTTTGALVADFNEFKTRAEPVIEAASAHESRITHLENGGSSASGSSRELMDIVSRVEGTVDMHDVRLAQSDLRFRLLETASFNGRLIWRIPQYFSRKQNAVEGRTLSLYSQPFYNTYFGYKMCARVYLNGDGLGKDSHMSLFFVIMRGEFDSLLSWPFRHRVTLAVLDQSGNGKHIFDTFRPDPTSTSFRRPVGEMNIASGSPMFATHSRVESGSYIKDDTLFIQVIIDQTDLKEPGL